jgi:hypothetical protein
MIAAAEANGVYHVKVTCIVADLGILGGEIKVEQVKASHSLISPATLKKWLDSLSTWGDIAAAFGKGLSQGAANSLNGAQDSFAHTGNLFLTYVNTVADVTDAFVGTPVDQRIRVPMIPLVDWSRGRFTAETDSEHSTSKTAGGFGLSVLGPMGYSRLAALRTVPNMTGAGKNLLAPAQAVASQIGHSTPWAQMTAAQRRAFQHSYSRHAQELGLPSWSQRNAGMLQDQFNTVVGYIRNNGAKLANPPKKPFNGNSVSVNFYEATFHGNRYYYYETLSGIFISAGRAF